MKHLANFKPLPLPSEYRWLAKERGPAVIVEALKLYGLEEIVGPQHNPVILEMADALGNPLADWYDSDEKAWCALFVSYILKRAGFKPHAGYDAVRARAYSRWGGVVAAPAQGDIANFWRGSPGGTDGHTGFLVGETATTYLVLGGNQKNAVNVAHLDKARLLNVVRGPWRPEPLKKFQRNGAPVSGNEA